MQWEIDFREFLQELHTRNYEHSQTWTPPVNEAGRQFVQIDSVSLLVFSWLPSKE